jgi:GDP-L-fucose synthase
MNILITGSSGFLGRHLSVFLEQKGHNVTKLNSSNVDLTNQQSCENIPKINYNQIYHLAAWTRAGDFCEHHQGDQWIINQLINTNILNWWKCNCPTAKMIAFGTSASYSKNYELEESNYMLGLPLDKYYSYAMSKRMLLSGLQSLQNQFSMNYSYFVPSTIYGPNYHNDGRQLHFIYDIIRKILDFKYLKKEIYLWGDGNQERELIYINDVIECVTSLSNITSNKIINIGSGEAISINNFAKMCCNIIGVDYANVKYDINGFVGNKSKVLNNKLMKLLYNDELINIQNGLEATIIWYEQNNYKSS